MTDACAKDNNSRGLGLINKINECNLYPVKQNLPRSNDVVEGGYNDCLSVTVLIRINCWQSIRVAFCVITQEIS